MPDPKGSAWLYERPFAHRGLHGLKKGVVENSRRAFLEAIRQRYGIELDVRSAADGTAMVFHDRVLDRLTAEKGPVARSPEELSKIGLSGSKDVIEPLGDILRFVAGRVPVLVKLKEDSGRHEDLCKSVAGALARYKGNAAVMSFNPDMMDWFRWHAPKIIRGIVSFDYADEDRLPAEECKSRANRPACPGSSRTSSAMASVPCPPRPVERARKQGLPINFWTVRSRAERLLARQFCDTMTFAGFVA